MGSRASAWSCITSPTDGDADDVDGGGCRSGSSVGSESSAFAGSFSSVGPTQSARISIRTRHWVIAKSQLKSPGEFSHFDVRKDSSNGCWAAVTSLLLALRFNLHWARRRCYYRKKSARTHSHTHTYMSTHIQAGRQTGFTWILHRLSLVLSYPTQIHHSYHFCVQLAD